MITLTARPVLHLNAETAEDLMVPNPVSVRANATVHEAMALLIDKGYSAAPVIDDTGKPVGVVSRSDILVHERQKIEHVEPEFYHRGELATGAGEPLSSGFQVERVDRAMVEDIMTPAVFAVPPDAHVSRVIEEMLTLKVHRLFVVGRDGVLVGVISALDLLRHLTQ